MRVDAIALDLRPRSMFEAADLGVRIVSANARAVWTSCAPVYVFVCLVAAATLYAGALWPYLALIWLKPWYDRSLLFVLARAVFGEATDFADLWAARRAIWWRGLFGALTLRRLSPWRSYVQPVVQLEGQRGSAGRARIALILGSHRGAALGMQSAFATVESALALGLVTLPVWFTPVDEGGEWIAAFYSGGSAWIATVQLACYATAVFVVEPFFVGAGLAMYLNRRVELEAWDIEQEFRFAFAA